MIGCQFGTETDGFGGSAAAARDLARSPVDQTNPRSSEIQHTHVMSDRWIINFKRSNPCFGPVLLPDPHGMGAALQVVNGLF